MSKNLILGFILLIVFAVCYAINVDAFKFMAVMGFILAADLQLVVAYNNIQRQRMIQLLDKINKENGNDTNETK